MLQFKIRIKDIKKPPVWRRVIVPETFTFHRLHEVIQAAFGWENTHLYQFSPHSWSREGRITLPYDDDWEPEPAIDSTTEKLKDIFKEEGQTYIYIYDFGDGWQHLITLEKMTDEKSLKASCLAGKGACPPEDCGGPWGYEGIKELFATKPESDEANELREWLSLKNDEVWEPNEFDLNETNEMVRDV